MGLPTMVEKVVDKFWTIVNWATYDGEVLVMRALRSILGGTGASECDKMEAQIRIPQQMSTEGHSDVEGGGRRERLDTAYDTRTAL